MLGFLVAILSFLRQVPARAAKIVYTNRNAAYYAIACIFLFSVIYHFIGIKKHFEVSEDMKGKEGSFFTSFYTSVLTQSNAMPDLVPKTTLARSLFMTQVASGWIWFLLFA